MTLYTAWRIDGKGITHWLEGISADDGSEAWDKGSGILDDWMKLHPGQESHLVIETHDGSSFGARPDDPEPAHDDDGRFSFNENTAAHFITGALTPEQKAAVLVDLLRGLQVGSVVGCLDLAADENPLILKAWLGQLEWLVKNKQMRHDEITARSILGNPRD